MEYELTVDRFDLLEGLKRFDIRRKLRHTERAVLGFDGRFFSIEALGWTVAAKAEGTWPGVATVGATVVAALAKVPPDGDPVKVTCRGGRLSIGALTVGCHWQPVSHTLLNLPAAPDWIEALSLKYRASRGQILSGGRDKDIKKAERKLAALTARVSKRLAPLGVTEQDLRALIEHRLADRYGRPAPSTRPRP